MKKVLFIIMLCLMFGHNGHHRLLTPYISPGIEIGCNSDKLLFISCQLTIGSGFKVGNHLEDTFPLFIGSTFGLRAYYQKNTPTIVYKYFDNQISFMIGGIGTGKLIDKNGKSFKKNKYWIGGLGLLKYEKIFFDNIIKKQYSILGVLPIPLFQ